MTDVIRRRASRLIVIDSTGRVLLFRHARQNGEMFWATPGGGLEPGETFEDAALREASEELRMIPLSITLLWQQITDFIYIDHPVRQQECFFRVRGDLTTICSDVEEIHGQENIFEARWWPLAELESSKDMIFPAALALKISALCP